uniref:General transcription factor IIF subunit 2 n=1 Tax=Phallusia mammillata TaxID=59560 RepID=A0A6F9DEU3_9ASCI|nr:general transcription factor IIF subunit 2 [Phallusia mammillata]
MGDLDTGDKTLDLSGAKHDVWLVKVPKYLATKWLNAPDGCPVGKLRISKNAGRTEVMYSMNSNLRDPNATSADANLSTDHKFALQGSGGQCLSVFSTTGNPKVGEKRCMEGRVVQKVDCRPVVSKNYMQLKKAQMIEASRPKRITKQLSSVVRTYKPVDITKEEREYKINKKKADKSVRMERDELQSALFKAFEKHQYYNIKDLKDITAQPITFLKEVLKEIGLYNNHTGHRHMWELKPEYRHHSKPEPTQQSDSDMAESP